MGKYISINTFIFSVSLDAKYPRLTAPVSPRDNERWAEQQLLSDIHLALLYKRNSYHSWRSLGRVCTWTKRWPVIHTLCFYSRTFIFGAFYVFSYQILTPLKSKNPCCALNTKRTRTIFFGACEFHRSYSGQLKGLLQQLNFAFSYVRGSRKWRLGFIFHLFSCWSAEDLCVLPGNEDENGTQVFTKGPVLCSYSGRPFVC